MAILRKTDIFGTLKVLGRTIFKSPATVDIIMDNDDLEERSIKNIIVSTEEPDPAEGQNGDIWFVREE